MEETTAPTAPDPWVLVYFGAHGRPAVPVGAFRLVALAPGVAVPVWEGRVYDLSDPAQIVEFSDAQYYCGKSPRYKPCRVRALPVRHFVAEAAEAEAAAALREARIIADAEAKAQAEAEMEAARKAEEAGTDIFDPDDGTEAERRLDGADDGAEADEGEEIPPYEDWKLVDLRIEAQNRGLELPEGANERSKKAWIDLLEADDANDSPD